MKKYIIIIIICVFLFIFLFYSFKIFGTRIINHYKVNTQERTKVVKADTINIDLPFFPQAPYGNWDLPYQETCEEASILLVANKLNNLQLDRRSFDTELLKIVEWEKIQFGSYFHTDIYQTNKIINDYFHLKTKIHENPGLNDIASIIAKGNLIIAPFAGKLLENPYYLNGGPKYHMMVIKGYNIIDKQIITHDVGTRRGENYVYSWNRINYALHDWNNIDMQKGKKLIIEIYK